MCLITRNQKQTSEEDITVFKVLDNDLKSPYMYFRYEFNKKYKTKIGFSDDWVVVDRQALDVITEILNENNLVIGHFNEPYNQIKLKNIGFNCYGEGFHSFKTQERAKSEIYSSQLLIECTIPKNTEYIIGEDECVISDEIILNKVVKNLNEF